jgi:murein DD-endopeptidase MepM/ murein hydrolase activator NlpD
MTLPKARAVPPGPHQAGISVTLAWPIDMGQPRGNGLKPAISAGYRQHLDRRPPSSAPGLDIAVDDHTEIYAAAGGRARAGHDDTAGNHVLIQHDKYTATLYCHLSAVWLVQNQHVLPGEVIGLAGRTGRATGPHLHFSVLYCGDYMDPEPLLPRPEPARGGEGSRPGPEAP